jgi:hypothetical protein
MVRSIQIAEGGELYSIKASATCAFGKPVTAAGAVATGNDYVGWAHPDNTKANVNGADQYVSGDIMNVVLRGPVLQVEAGGVFAIGDFLKNGTGGKLIEETDGAVRTVLTVAIGLEAGADTAWVRIVEVN